MKVAAVTGGKLPTVEACVGGKGPYAFVVDTGSSRSIIDSSLSSSLNLKAPTGQHTADLGGSGCATTGSLVAVPALQVGDISLAPQTMVSSSLSDWAGKSVDGVLGSDVFGRFGAVKLDLTKQTLTVSSAEGQAPMANSLLIGRSGASAPPTLLNGQTPADVVPLTVVQQPGTIAAYANMTVNHAGNTFVVDSGAPVSTMDTAAASSAKIANKGTAPAPAGIGCSGNVTTLNAAPVSIGSMSATLSMLSIHITGVARNGVNGYLGLDFLGTSGALVVDYVTASLTFLAG